MKKISLFFILITSVVILLFGFNNCGINQGFKAGNTDAPLTSSSLTMTENINVMKIDAGGCGGYINQPCVSVKICVPGTNNCQTINRLLLDTGSYGLRVFKSVVNLNLPDVTDTSQKTYAECIEYLDGSAQWGPVKKADVVLGGLKASQVSIQIVDSTYATVPTNCGESSNSLDISPEEEGFNGILGVGLFSEDCGAGCANSATNGLYFSCSGLSCTGATIPISKQVTNPVSMLPSDNNGVIVDLPAISSNGTTQVFGSLIF
ncbi:MAG: DUF3443 family protein [Pseudobdellovibrionaceae bacterium]